MKRIIPLFFTCTLGVLLVSGFEAGKTAFTKRYETAVLKEPQAAAETITTLPFAASIKVTALQGKWASVSTTNGAGWIYLGNLAEEKPAADHSVDWLRAGAN